jgi:hypothetical protein
MAGKIHNRARYSTSPTYKIKRGFTFFLIAYLLLSLLPLSPALFSSVEMVASNNRVTSWGNPAIKVSTNADRDYLIDAEGPGEPSFNPGDTITVFRSLLLKTRSIYHHRSYRLFYFEHFGSLLFLGLVSILLIILTLSKDHRVEKAFNIITVTALALFLLHLCN